MEPFEVNTYLRLFGYDQGVMSGLLTGTAFTTQFPEIGELRAELHSY
jgi:hypothetical protein